MTVAATLCVVAAIALLAVFPGVVPALFSAPTLPAVVAGLTVQPPTAVPLRYPTLPPAWTSTPIPPASDTAPPGGNATATSAFGQGVTPLPNLNSTAQAGSDARVSASVAKLAVRSIPGTAGVVILTLPSLTPLKLIGRTPDNVWLQVITPDGLHGWVTGSSLDVFVSMISLPVTAGAALDASPTPLTPIGPADARIKPVGNNLRLRQSPGTAGAIIAYLPALMALHLIGRTDDNIWLQVITENKLQGWVMSQFLDINIGLDRIPVTGTAVNVPPPTTGAASANTGGGVATDIVYIPTATPTPTSTPSPVPPSPTPTASPTWTPSATPTSSPGDYNHPTDYIRGITGHARQIYLAGQSAGNRANVFSKVGDSITVAPQFLYPFGNGPYDLRGYGYLAGVVDRFRSGWARDGNSFANNSMAAKGGWSSFSVISPSAADPSVCRWYESPLVCEYRVSQPAVALIMVGTNDILDTSSDNYRLNLERVVADTLSRHIIPVLCTIPPFHRTGHEARVTELNGIIAAVAQENDIPLLDYWMTLQNLPNQGLGPDGVHPSSAPNPADFTADNLQYGNTVHNLVVLQALDAIWHLAMY